MAQDKNSTEVGIGDTVSVDYLVKDVIPGYDHSILRLESESGVVSIHKSTEVAKIDTEVKVDADVIEPERIG